MNSLFQVALHPVVNICVRLSIELKYSLQWGSFVFPLDSRQKFNGSNSLRAERIEIRLQKSLASFRNAVKDLKNPALQCRRLAGRSSSGACELDQSRHSLTRTPGPQVGLYKAHSGIKCWSSEKLEPRIPPCVNVPFVVRGCQSGCRNGGCTKSPLITDH